MVFLDLVYGFFEKIVKNGHILAEFESGHLGKNPLKSITRG